MFNNLAKSRLLVALPIAAGFLIATDCTAAGDANEAAGNSVDLATSVDLFSSPVKENPVLTDPERVVVTVNGTEIKQGEINKQMEQVLKMYQGQIPPQQMAQAKQRMQESILDQLITKTVLNGAVKEAGITVSEEEMAAEMAEFKSTLPPETNLEEELKKNDTSLDEIKEQMKETMLYRKLMDEKTKNVSDATEEEAKEFYDSNPDSFKKPENATASHILIKFEETDTDEIKAEKKAKLEKIRADIIAGTITFEDAAKEHSDDPGSKDNGGKYEGIRKGQMVPEFEMATFTQELNEIGDVVETSYGYHIIKVSAREEASVIPLEEVKEDLMEFLTKRKKQEAVQAYLKSLRESATITKAE